MLVRVTCSPTHHRSGVTAYWWFSQIPKKYQNTFKHFSSCSVLCVQALSLLTSSNFFWPLFVAACLIGGRTEPAPPQKQPQIRALPVRPDFPLRGLGWSTPYPPLVLCGWALCPGLVLLLSIPNHLLKRWPGEGVFGTKKLFQATSYKDGLRGSWKPFLLAALCVQALSSSCPLWLGLVLFLSLPWPRP